MKKFSFVLGVALAACVPVLRAIQPVDVNGSWFLWPTPASPQDGNYGTLGTVFTVNPGYIFTLSDVGYWDWASDGVQGATPISVALFNNATQQIVAGTQKDFSGMNGVAMTGTGNNGVYRFLTLSSPVVLTAGTYTIGEWNYGLNGQDLFGNKDQGNAPNIYGGAITLVGSTLEGSVNGAFPALSNSPNADFYAGNFFGIAGPAPIPEPATWAAICGALALGLASVRRHCHARVSLS